MLFWGWNMRDNYDFDASYLYNTMYLKLDRTYSCMVNNSHCVWNDSVDSKMMRRLCEAKVLSKRLLESKYGSHVDTFLNKYCIIRDKNDLMSQINVRYSANSKIVDKTFYVKGLKEAMKKDNRAYSTDRKRFFRLLEKYTDYWWD